MRVSFVVILSSLVTTSIALADAPIDPASVPAPCADLAKVPPSATIPQPAMEARIAVASCGANVRFKALKLVPGDLNALNDAAKPSLDLLDGVIAQNDAVWSPVAKRARANLFLSMAIRARNAIPEITMQTIGAALADHDQAHAALEPKIKPWLDQAAQQ